MRVLEVSSFSLVIGTLTACFGIAAATWKYSAEERYCSDIAIRPWLPSPLVPQVYNQASHEFLRVIPMASTFYSKDATAMLEPGADRVDYYGQNNVLQIFSDRLSLEHRRKIDPSSGPIEALDIYYHNFRHSESSSRNDLYGNSTETESSSLEASMSSGPMTGSSSYGRCDRVLMDDDSDYRATLVAGNKEEFQATDYPSMFRKCGATSASPSSFITETTTPSGHTYRLYAESLLIYDRRCRLVASLGPFVSGQNSYTAVGLVVDECKGVLMVMAEGLFGLFYGIHDLQLIDAFYLLVEPVMSPILVFPSAMDWPQPPAIKFVFRFFIEDREHEAFGLYYYFVEFLPGEMKILRKHLEKDGIQNPLATQKALASLCMPLLPNSNDAPVIVNDYHHRTDFVMTRGVDNAPFIHFYASRFAGNNPDQGEVSRFCYDMSICPNIDGPILSASLAQHKGHHDGGHFYLTFRSLDVLRVSYSHLHDTIANYY